MTGEPIVTFTHTIPYGGIDPLGRPLDIVFKKDNNGFFIHVDNGTTYIHIGRINAEEAFQTYKRYCRRAQKAQRAACFMGNIPYSFTVDYSLFFANAYGLNYILF